MINDLSEVTLFKDIPKDELSGLMPLFKKREFKKNHMLIFEDDQSDEVYIIRSGLVKAFRMKDDKEIVFGFHFSGDTVGESEALHYNKNRLVSIEALDAVSAWMITKGDFLSMIDKYPSVLRRAYVLLLERLHILNRRVRSMTFDDMRTKTASLIMDLYHNFGIQDEGLIKINFKLTQTQLADMLGITRESISKTISELQKEGIISIRQKYMYILELSKLEHLCDNSDETFSSRKWYER